MKSFYQAELVVLVVALLAVSGCGGGSGSGTNYTLSSGTYQLSNISATPPDDCNLAGDLRPGDTIRISVSGSNATFGFEDAPDPDRDLVAIIQGNNINTGSKTYDKDHHATDVPFDCVETITVTVSGTLTGQNQIQATVGASSTLRSGMQCTADRLDYKRFPCTSTLSFTAKKM